MGVDVTFLVAGRDMHFLVFFLLLLLLGWWCVFVGCERVCMCVWGTFLREIFVASRSRSRLCSVRLLLRINDMFPSSSLLPPQ